MEQERLAKELEEKEKAEKEKKLKEGYGLEESSEQWQKDRDAALNLAKEQRADAADAAEANLDPVTKPQGAVEPGKAEGRAAQDETDLTKGQPQQEKEKTSLS